MFSIQWPSGTDRSLWEMERTYDGLGGNQRSGPTRWEDYLQKSRPNVISATVFTPNNSLYEQPVGALRPSNFAGKASQFAAQARKGLGSVVSNLGRYSAMLGLAGTTGLTWLLGGKISSLFGFGKK